jgi:hypothetical protein
MSKLNGRKLVDININALSDKAIPLYDSQYRLWNTINYQDLTSGSAQLSGSNNFSGSQNISGSVTITGSLTVNGSSVVLTTQTSSMSVASASFSTTSSYAITASHALNVPATASWANNAISSSYALTEVRS